MKSVKLIAAALLVAVALILIKLPGQDHPSVKAYQSLEEFEKLPDFDFRTEAAKLWDSGEEDAALLLLEEIAKNDWPDKDAAEQLHANYKEEILANESIPGRITSFGTAFVTGNVNSFEELAGASLADFFLYGDVRDLTREIVFEHEKSHLIIALSSIGILTTAFPPADPIASLLKTAHKTNSLTEPMTKHLIKVLEPLKNGTAKLSTSTLKGIVGELKPIWTLAQNSKSWQQFSLFMKHCKNTRQVKFISKIISKPGNSEKLAVLLSSMRKLPNKSAQMLDHIQKYGQKGMDSVYAVLRKGPAGIQFMIKNPTLYSRLAKNSVKATDLTVDKIEQSWSKLLNKYGMPVNILRYLFAILCLYGIKLILFPSKRKITDREITSEKGQKFNPAFLLAALFAVLLFFFIAAPGSSAIPSLSNSSATQTSSGIALSSIIFFLVFLGVQFWSAFKARHEIDEILKIKEHDKKIKLLENSEFYFDLPVYAGLAGTVCAFILLSFDPGGSRILAYATTICGISVSVLIRGKWLFPARKRIINGEENE